MFCLDIDAFYIERLIRANLLTFNFCNGIHGTVLLNATIIGVTHQQLLAKYGEITKFCYLISRYPNLNVRAVTPIQVCNLLDTDDPESVKQPAVQPEIDIPKKRRRRSEFNDIIEFYNCLDL